jgi:hypothetical protein
MGSIGWERVEVFEIFLVGSPAQRLTVEVWARGPVADTHDGPMLGAGRPDILLKTDRGASVYAMGDGSDQEWFEVDGRPGRWQRVD